MAKPCVFCAIVSGAKEAHTVHEDEATLSDPAIPFETRAVLNAAAERGDWGKPLPPGVHRGIAQFMGYGSYSAAVAEVSVSGKGEVKVHRMVLALNCGHAVNPATIAAQVDSR